MGALNTNGRLTTDQYGKFFFTRDERNRKCSVLFFFAFKIDFLSVPSDLPNVTSICWSCREEENKNKTRRPAQLNNNSLVSTNELEIEMTHSVHHQSFSLTSF